MDPCHAQFPGRIRDHASALSVPDSGETASNAMDACFCCRPRGSSTLPTLPPSEPMKPSWIRWIPALLILAGIAPLGIWIRTTHPGTMPVGIRSQDPQPPGSPLHRVDPQTVAAVSALEASEADATERFWRHERIAQQLGRTIEAWWDELNTSSNRMAFAAQIPFGSIRLPIWDTAVQLPPRHPPPFVIQNRSNSQPRRVVEPNPSPRGPDVADRDPRSPTGRLQPRGRRQPWNKQVSSLGAFGPIEPDRKGGGCGRCRCALGISVLGV